MPSILMMGGLVLLSVLTFFDTALDSLDIRSHGQEGVQTETLLKEDIARDLSVKTIDESTYLSFNTTNKYISIIKIGDNPERQDTNYIINPYLETDHFIQLKGLEKPKSYFFRIQLIDKNGVSNFSKVYNFKTKR